MPANNGDAALDGAVSAEEIATHKERLGSDVSTLVYESIQFFRKKLSVVEAPPIRRIVDAGLLPDFVRLLEKHEDTRVRYEAAWCLTNVASGDSEMTRAVVDAGALPLFTALISLDRALSADKDIASLCEQSIWAVGNICGDSTAMRDLVIDSGVPQKMAAILEQAAEITEKPHGGVPLPMLRNVSWCSSNIFRGKPKPAYTAPLADLLRAFCGLVKIDDSDTRIDVIWGLSYACEIDPEGATEVAEIADIAAIVDIARDADLDVKVRIPALRIVGNLVSCAEDITQAVVDADGVAAFFGIALEGGIKKSIQKEALWALSNIAAGTKAQSMAVALHPQMQELCMLIPALPAECLKEGLWVISNACQCKDAQVVDAVISGGGMAALVKGLALPDSKAKMVALEGLECILSVPPSAPGADEDARATALEEIGGVAALEACQLDEHPNVYRLAVQILENFFHAEVDERGGDAARQADALNTSVEAIQLDDD